VMRRVDLGSALAQLAQRGGKILETFVDATLGPRGARQAGATE